MVSFPHFTFIVYSPTVAIAVLCSLGFFFYIYIPVRFIIYIFFNMLPDWVPHRHCLSTFVFFCIPRHSFFFTHSIHSPELSLIHSILPEILILRFFIMDLIGLLDSVNYVPPLFTTNRPHMTQWHYLRRGSPNWSI